MDEASNTSKLGVKIIEISIWKGFTILATAVIGTGVTVAYGTVRMLNNDHYTLVGMGYRVASLEANHVDPKILDLQYAQMNTRLDRIERKIDTLK